MRYILTLLYMAACMAVLASSEFDGEIRGAALLGFGVGIVGLLVKSDDPPTA